MRLGQDIRTDPLKAGVESTDTGGSRALRAELILIKFLVEGEVDVKGCEGFAWGMWRYLGSGWGFWVRCKPDKSLLEVLALLRQACFVIGGMDRR